MHIISLEPLNCHDMIFTVFGLFLGFIRGQSVTQRIMSRDALRYPPQDPGPYKGQKFQYDISRLWQLKGYIPVDTNSFEIWDFL